METPQDLDWHGVSTALTGTVLQVSELNRFVRRMLESGLPLLQVSGEISNLTRAPSGHLYFTLKDEQAQVRCTMWRSRAQLLSFQPQNGMQVIVRARAGLYETRGEFQLSVEAVAQTGTGNLSEQFFRLKNKLAAEGLFDQAHKKAIPQFPRKIGVVTSPAAAALQDVLVAMRRRAPHVPLILYPAPVQGREAGSLLAQAVITAGRRARQDQVDVLLLVRGGGSLEDLAAFNDEALARAVYACAVPVISGVGHETDFSISDFVADVRAATPTVAAELASAGFADACDHVQRLRQQLVAGLRFKLDLLTQRLDRAALRLVDPRQRLKMDTALLSTLEQTLRRAMHGLLTQQRLRYMPLPARLVTLRPDMLLRHQYGVHLSHRLQQAMCSFLQREKDHVLAQENALTYLDPTAVLARGYGIVRTREGRVLTDASSVTCGQSVSIVLAQGELGATVDEIRASADR